MRKLLLIILCVIVAILAFINIYGHQTDMSRLSLDSTYQEEVEDSETDRLWVDTIMYANGHSFGYSGDVSDWGGWYFDSIFVGDNIMLHCDSVGPTSLKLDLITRQTTVDLGCRDALVRIRKFLNPIEGFEHYRKKEEVYYDSIIDEKYGMLKCLGYFCFSVDYADSCHTDADRLNRFVAELINNSGNIQVNVPALTALYIGYSQAGKSNRYYGNKPWNMDSLSNFVLDDAINGWKQVEDYQYIGSMGFGLAVDAHIATANFATFSVYDYYREGSGHGMYAETFHTFDMKSGMELSNSDIFKPHTLEKVKLLLFEVMAQDPRYTEWNPGLTSASDVQERIDGWQSPSPLLDGTEWEESKRESEFCLPEGALTNSGIVFSFQPYEIGCWAEGAYHFTIPYEKLRPYLTTRVENLIKS